MRIYTLGAALGLGSALGLYLHDIGWLAGGVFGVGLTIWAMMKTGEVT